MIPTVNMVTTLTTEILGLSGFSRSPDLSVSGTAAQTGELYEGAYDVWCTTDVYLKVATTANNVTTSSGYLLRANNTITITVSSQEKVGAITNGSVGTLSLHRVK